MPRKAGPEGVKSTTVTIRLTPKMRFGLELMSRLYHDSVQTLLLKSIDELFNAEHGGLQIFLNRREDEMVEGVFKPVDLLKEVWSDSEGERLVSLALLKPDLLNSAERDVWERVKREDRYWSYGSSSENRVKNALLLEQLDEDWDGLCP